MINDKLENNIRIFSGAIRKYSQCGKLALLSASNHDKSNKVRRGIASFYISDFEKACKSVLDAVDFSLICDIAVSYVNYEKSPVPYSEYVRLAHLCGPEFIRRGVDVGTYFTFVRQRSAYGTA